MSCTSIEGSLGHVQQWKLLCEVCNCRIYKADIAWRRAWTCLTVVNHGDLPRRLPVVVVRRNKRHGDGHQRTEANCHKVPNQHWNIHACQADLSMSAFHNPGRRWLPEARRSTALSRVTGEILSIAVQFSYALHWSTDHKLLPQL